MECAISEITGHREVQYRERRQERDAQRGAAAIASHVASPSPKPPAKPNNQQATSPILLLFFYHLFMSGARSGWIMARSPTAYHTSHRKVGVEIAECWGSWVFNGYWVWVWVRLRVSFFFFISSDF